jgi:Zn-dependent peptidase ImmA (M78 family)
VSREVIYRKLLNRELISEKEYEDAAASWAKQATPKERGGNYYYNQIAYLGARYIDLALTRYNQHRFDSTQLAAYLNIKPKNVEAFEFVYAGLK